VIQGGKRSDLPGAYLGLEIAKGLPDSVTIERDSSAAAFRERTRSINMPPVRVCEIANSSITRERLERLESRHETAAIESYGGRSDKA